ncbi:MAG: D-glycero-beta-D-manno-heptose 1-phosphate adenylyltransferase [bacterium]
MKLISSKKISALIKKLKEQKKKIIFTNGCFDIIHRGHIEYLKKAKSSGDVLIVGINSDDSVKKLKGPLRPINKLNDRIYILEHLDFIDYIVSFSEETPYKLIKIIKPNVLVKGGDYKPEEVIGREFSKKLKIINFVKNYSTTGLINKIQKAAK